MVHLAVDDDGVEALLAAEVLVDDGLGDADDDPDALEDGEALDEPDALGEADGDALEEARGFTVVADGT